MDNLEIYNKVANVPNEAKKSIVAGRLKGKTDINPMWRIKALTEVFGVCGVGWKYEITNKEIIDGAEGIKCAIVDINLYIKVNGEWSDAIPGTGGSSFVAKEQAGLYTSDECFKMALTDAISVSCKALGVGADVYWQAGRSKYTALTAAKKPSGISEETKKALNAAIASLNKAKGYMTKDILASLAKPENVGKAHTEYTEDDAQKALTILNAWAA